MPSKTLTAEQIKAYSNLKINQKNRVILSLDGGGVRGILTLQLLKKIEEIAGIPCYKFCDLIAGTSTGAIIASLMSVGKTAVEIEGLYLQFVTKVFQKRSLLASRFLNPPAYDKVNFRQACKNVLGNITLEQACNKTGIDLFITSKDVTDNEETYFTCFAKDGVRNGTYKESLLRSVVEATMSAPTYFSPFERFIDGGTTTYNNPSLAALLEAISYSGKGKYKSEEITLFSLGTGKIVHSVSPEDAANPKGLDAYFWLNYVMGVASQDASTMQVDTFRSTLLPVDYRRFQISLDSDAIGKIPDKNIVDLHIGNAPTLHALTDSDLQRITMDDISKFDLLRVIGGAMTEYIMKTNKFTSDLNNTPTKRDELVTAFNTCIPFIQNELKKPEWVDNLPS